MNRLGRCTIVLAAAVILFAGFAPAGAETIEVTQFTGTFDTIDVSDDGSFFELLGGRITDTFAPLPEPLTIEDVIVRLTGYDTNGGNVIIDELTIKNPSNDTTASLDVNSATLTQVLSPPDFPIGVGYISLALTLSGGDLMTDADSKPIHLDVSKSVVTINGLVVTTDDTNGTASLGTLSSASISALVPEPSSSMLALLAVAGCGGYCWRRRCRGCRRRIS